jgi:hypothetical protein
MKKKFKSKIGNDRAGFTTEGFEKVRIQDKEITSQDILKWAKKERKEYDKIIKELEKQIAFEKSLPKINRKNLKEYGKTNNKTNNKNS